MNKTNEEVQAGVTRYWKRVASQHNMTVDEYHEYRKMKNEEKRKEWGLSMANAITRDDAFSLREYAQNLADAAMTVSYLTIDKSDQDESLGETICLLHDRLRLVTAVLDRIDENRD
jgi:hypothetical protein